MGTLVNFEIRLSESQVDAIRRSMDAFNDLANRLRDALRDHFVADARGLRDDLHDAIESFKAAAKQAAARSWKLAAPRVVRVCVETPAHAAVAGLEAFVAHARARVGPRTSARRGRRWRVTAAFRVRKAKRSWVH